MVFCSLCRQKSPVVACQIHQLDSRLQVIHRLGTHPCHSRWGFSLWPGTHVCQQAVALERRNKGPIIWGKDSEYVGKIGKAEILSVNFLEIHLEILFFFFYQIKAPVRIHHPSKGRMRQEMARHEPVITQDSLHSYLEPIQT